MGHGDSNVKSTTQNILRDDDMKLRNTATVFTLLVGLTSQGLWAFQGCHSVGDVLNWLAINKKSPATKPIPVLVNMIKKLGFCGRPTAAEYESILAAGATKDLMAVIPKPLPTERGGPPKDPIQPPPRQKEGTLRVLCQPVECNVTVVGGQALGLTTKGELSATLLAGPISVGASQPDYDSEPKVHNVEIKDHETTTVTFKLSVSPDGLLREGKKQFSQMIAALGGDEGLKALSFFKASGSLQCYDASGQQTVWDISSALMKPPAQARFEVVRRGKKGTYIAATSERGLEWDKTEKWPQFDELDIALQRFEEYQISRLIERFKNEEFKMIASDLSVKPGDETVIRAEGGGKAYRIRIGVDHRPRQIAFESGMLEKGLKISYADYAERAGTAYPMSIQIQYPDAERHGLAVTFRTLDLNPADVKDTDFRLKKKGNIFQR